MRNDGPSRWLLLSISGEPGWLNGLRLFVFTRLTEFTLENRTFSSIGMDSICLVISAFDFYLGGLLFLNWVQHRARSDSIVNLAS